MTAKGADVTEVAAYESACPSTMPLAAEQILASQNADILTFVSSKTVRHFARILAETFGADWLNLLQNVGVASIGPQTSRDCRELLGKVTVEASEYTLEGLIAGLEQWARS